MTADLDLDALAKVAGAPTQAAWSLGNKVQGFDFTVCNARGDAEMGTWLIAGVRWQQNAEFIATFDPPTVLALIAAAREAMKVTRDAALEDAATLAQTFAFKADGRTAYGSGYSRGYNVAMENTASKIRALKSDALNTKEGG